MAFNLGDVFVTFKSKAEDFKKGLNNVQSGVTDFAQGVKKINFKDFARRAADSFNSITGAIENVAKKVVILAGAGTFGIGKFVSLAGELQTTQARMAALAGSTEKAKKIFGELYNYTLGKPIAFPDASKAAQTLMGYGVAADSVVDAMKTLSAFSIVNGADMGQLALAYGQVNAKGRLMGQEIIQLTNNFVPVSQVIAKHFNVSIQEAMALMEDGKVTAAQFNQAMAEFIPQEKIAEQSNTFKNRLISLQGAIRSFGLALIGVKVDPDLGLVVEPGGAFDRLSNLLPKIADSIKSLKPAAAGAFNWIMNNGKTVTSVIAGIAAAYIAAKIAAIAFSIAAAANPITLIATAVVLLIGALVALQMRFDWIGKVLEFLQPLWQALVDIFNTHILPSIKSLAQTFINDLLPALMQIWESVVRLWNSLNPGLMTALKIIGAIIGGALIAAIWLVINGLKVSIAIFSAVISVVSNLINWIGNVIKWYGNFYAAVINAVKGALNWFGRLPGSVADVIGKIVGWFGGLAGRIGGAIGGIVSVITAPFRSAFNAIARFWNGTIGKLSFKAPSWVPGIGGKGFTMPTLPQLALGTANWKGGWATVGEHGREAVFLPKGAQVMSADKTRRMGASGDVKIYGDINIDSEQDANYFLKRISRNQELEIMGLSPAYE